MGKVAVVAVGGNSLIKDDQHQSVEDQYQAVVETSRHVAGLIEAGWNVVLTHGNGPQVGFILLRSEMSRSVLHPVPLDSCGADSQGAIGYQFQQALHNEFHRRGIRRSAVTVVTQCVVDAADPAFQKPTKPIGPFYSQADAEQRKADEGWAIMEDAGRGWRRVVASPQPKEIVEQDAIQTLITQGYMVIAVGGGGVPVVRRPDGDLQGTAAVIDKDLASSLLAANLKADLFLISTGVEKVCLHFGTPQQRALDRMTVAEAKRYIDEGHFKPGSMLPKMKAVISFLERGGGEAIITNPESLERAVAGRTGTRIVAR